MRRETTENLGREDMRLEEEDSPVHCAMLRRDVGARTGQDRTEHGGFGSCSSGASRASARLPMQASGISCWHKK